MTDHIKNRDLIVQRLQEELIGPASGGKEVDCTRPVVFAQPHDAYGPWCQAGSRDEILQRDPPTRRYGIGVLYPLGTADEDDPRSVVAGLVQESQSPEETSNTDTATDTITESYTKGLDTIASRSGRDDSTRDDDFDLSGANSYRPSTMGVSFLASIPRDAVLEVSVTGGRYRKWPIRVGSNEWTWWLRAPVSAQATFSAGKLLANHEVKLESPLTGESLEGLRLAIEVFSRPHDNQQRLITVCLVNRHEAKTTVDDIALFQTFFKVLVRVPDGASYILPYPRPVDEEQLDAEEQSLSLLYRHAQTFATGHGCAANWGFGEGPIAPGSVEHSQLNMPEGDRAFDRVAWVSAECFPIFETPSVTPNITRLNGTLIEVPMAPLAGLVPGNDGMAAVREVVKLYEDWITEKEQQILTLDSKYHGAAQQHLAECKRCATRMREGLNYLATNSTARLAFQLANYSILLQQLRSRRESRGVQFDPKSNRLIFSEPYRDPDLLDTAGGRGKWRAFQIAFLLMSIRSCADASAPDRETVELIWFPTGGGKTEAYLGLAAFSMFMERLENPDATGVQVIMRYTLRLLTAQQFQRAAGLLCAMEYLRRQNASKLGKQEFSIGIWLGGSTTPNRRDDALYVLRSLQKGNPGTENQFVLSRCPWCGAHLGPLNYTGKAPKNAPRLVGYEQRINTVIFRCPDQKCCFSASIPVYVIDEDIYEKRPSMVIGTVDKFAMLAWRPEARGLFGLNMDGERVCMPPGLIIQDELHLIAGPLGSMVGLYEAVIETLCSNQRQNTPIRPKIVSSTATIRRYADQVKALYARTDVALFPPPGLDASDSFFARYDRLADGRLQRGRMYVGVHGPGLGSIQTAQVRTFTALLQAPVPLSPPERDPWWSLLLFFNSLRELGTTVSLFQSDIPDYLKVLQNRMGLDHKQMRMLSSPLELTGRLKSDEVPQAITALEVPTTSKTGEPVDVCLASNIIEVGVDIDRLSVMAVVGQPKTTSQYIQVTGRVGRKWWERPGLVVTVYGASKPRDRSHFEKFRSYHERLYAQVEPTSVTPFSPPVLDRALHAVMTAYIRQINGRETAIRPTPYPKINMDRLYQLLVERVGIVDPAEIENLERVFRKRENEWKRWDHARWAASGQDEADAMLRQSGAYVSRERARRSWSTPMSMRNVDAECLAYITQLYLYEKGDGDGE